MYKNIYSSILQNSPKLETTQLSMNTRMDKHTLTYLYNGIPTIKRRIPATAKMNLKNIV